MTQMRAKFYVSNIEKFDNSERITFNAVAAGKYPEDGSDENNSYAKWTPNASCLMTINNPALIGKFNSGDTFYVDFTPVQKI